MSRQGRRARTGFHVVAVVEACTWLGLLAAMAGHYLGGASRAGIELFGALHGAAFIAYVVVTVVAARVLRWSWWVGLLALVASLPPALTVVFGVVAERRGWLGPRGVLDPVTRTAHPAPSRS